MAGRGGAGVTRFVGVAMVGVLLAGCYTLAPARGAVPEPGTQVAFDLNDAGRTGLGTSLGPEVAQVEGRLVAREGGDYVLAVTEVRLLRGGVQVWSGEQVRIKSEYVGPPYVRRFDTARSVAVGGTVVGGFAAFLVTRALTGKGSGGENGGRDSAQVYRGRP
jgi:hypothetical protein